MPLPVISNVFRTTLDWTNPDGAPADVHNVLHFIGDTGDVTDLCNLINTHMTTYAGNMLLALSSAYSLTSVTVLPLDGSSGGTTVSVSGPTGAAGDDYIAQGCNVISLYTGARGPQGRGRIYLGPVGEDVQDHGHVAVTAINVTTAWKAFADDMASDGAQLAVASYVHAVARPVADFAMHSPLFTQRRRALK